MIPFYSKAAKKDVDKGDIIHVTDAQLVSIRAVNVNMVKVLGEVEEKPKKTEQKK